MPSQFGGIPAEQSNAQKMIDVFDPESPKATPPKSQFGGVPVRAAPAETTSKFGGVPVQSSDPKSQFGGIPADAAPDISRHIGTAIKERAGEAVDSLPSRAQNVSDQTAAIRGKTPEARRAALDSMIGGTEKALSLPVGVMGSVPGGVGESIERQVALKAGVKPPEAEKLARDTGDVASNLAMILPGGKAAPKVAELPKAPPVIEKPAGEAAPPALPASKEITPPAAEPVTPETISDELFRISNKDEARRIDYVNSLKGIKDVPNETWEKLYAYEDNPKGIALAPEEKALYDNTFSKINVREKELRQELAKKGVPFEEEAVGGAPRKVQGKNALVEKIYGNEEASKTARAGSKLSTYSPTLQGRSMWALPGEVGKRSVVFVKDGKLFKDGQPVGEVVGSDVSPKAGLETTLGKLQQATTNEIESNTKIQYHKNLLANKYLNIQSLERANDAANFIDSMKKNPEFLEHAAAPGAKDLPESWRKLSSENKAFDDWKFDPKMAEVFEDYLGNIKSPEEFSNGVMRVARAMKASIFYNPIRHMVNATNMFGTSLGAAGGAKSLATGRLPMALAKATKSVLTQDASFRKAAEEGLSMPGGRNVAAQFHEELMRAMGRSVQSDPQAFAQLAKKWGYKSTVGLVKGLYKGSSNLLWNYSDILTKARYDLYRQEGYSPKEAVHKTHQLMASYRVPSRVAGSRKASQVLQDPRLTMFGRYDYNRMANIADTMKRAAKNDKEGWEARDQLLALAAITTVGYKAFDKMLQEGTEEPDAHYSMGGYSSLVDIGDAALSGRKSPSQAAMSAFSPGLLSTPLEVLTGQNIYTGKPIAQRGDWNNLVSGEDPATDAARIGYDLTSYAADKFAPIQAIQKAIEREDSTNKILLEQLGATFPADSTKAEKYSRNAAKSAAKKRPEFVP